MVLDGWNAHGEIFNNLSFRSIASLLPFCLNVTSLKLYLHLYVPAMKLYSSAFDREEECILKLKRKHLKASVDD